MPILNKSQIFINLTVATNAGAMGYLTTKTRVEFTYLRQTFTEKPIV